MIHIKCIFILSTFLILLPFSTEAQNASSTKTIVVDSYSIHYDEALSADENGNNVHDRTTYYLAGKMVLTAYDSDENGADDLWFRWDGNDRVNLEMSDNNNDGIVETVSSVDRNGKTTIIKAPEPTQKPRISAENRMGGKTILYWLIVITLGYFTYRKIRPRKN